jgi:hypothetical protein
MNKEPKEARSSEPPEEIDIKKVLMNLAEIALATGEFMIKIGEAGIKVKEPSKPSSEWRSLKSAQVGELLLKQIPEEKIGPILKVMHEMGGPPELSSLMSEPSEGLITKGKKIVSDATRLKKLLE